MPAVLSGQIAKIKGCKVIGIAGGKDKCDYVINDLGFDGCIDYKNESVTRGIKRECLNGIDVYFDNVGGDILDAALIFINKNASFFFGILTFILSGMPGE